MRVGRLRGMMRPVKPRLRASLIAIGLPLLLLFATSAAATTATYTGSVSATGVKWQFKSLSVAGSVRRMADLEEMSLGFRRVHGQRVRVATKYMNLTRRFFSHKGVTGYRIVESLGATEGTPAAGLAELIVDITTTGATLKANGLRVLDDGLLLKSEANLMASKAAHWTPGLADLERRIAARFA